MPTENHGTKKTFFSIHLLLFFFLFLNKLFYLFVFWESGHLVDVTETGNHSHGFAF